MIKILSIDGGGIRGIIPAVILCEIEERTGNRVAEMFDLIAGTSTGGLIALALNVPDSNGKPLFGAHQIREIYEKYGADIFRQSIFKKIMSFGGYFDLELSSISLYNLLDQYFDGLEFLSSIRKVLINTYDIENRHPYFFRSWNENQHNVKMKDIAMATCAAPSYFEPYRVEVNGSIHTLIDGGVFNNNPALSAYLEAINIFGKEDNFLVLSLGTGENTRSITYEEARSWGKVEWILPALDIIFDGMINHADYHLELLLKQNYYRFQVMTNCADFKIDTKYKSQIQIENFVNEAKAVIRSRQSEFDDLCNMLV